MADEITRYSAFVSYRHMPRDRQWALRVMRELETYRTPKALQRQAFPKRIGHLFRDEDEIPASTDLSDQIKDALAKSDFLIVVCSPDTPASRWVRREIELFQEMGKSERIMPLLIAGEPEESFPPELRRRRVAVPRDDGGADFVWEEVEPVAADVRPRKDESRAKTERRALLRLAAALLGCRFDDLARRDEERRKAALRRNVGAGVGLLAMAGVGGLWWWDANLRVHTQYCANYGERWAAPFCVGELSEAEQRARTTSYRFKTRNGEVQEMARVNGTGALSHTPNNEYEEEPWTKDVALWRFTYASSASGTENRLASARLDDKTGKQVRLISYNFLDERPEAFAKFDRDSSSGVSEQQMSEGSALGLRAFGKGVIWERANIGQHRLSFSEKGLLLRRAFQPIGGGSTVADSNGVYGRLYTYGAKDLVETTRNLDIRGDALGEKTGIAGQRRSYDVWGDLTSIEWLDANGKLRANEQWYAKVVFTRGAHGNIVREEYRNENDAAAIRHNGRIASLSRVYDANGNIVDERYFGLDGKPSLTKNGYARVTKAYDESGNIVEITYFGRDGRRIRSKEGVARLTRAYDERGNQVEEAYFDLDGKPVLNIMGFARGASRYDEAGNALEFAYFGVDGKPTLNKFGVARFTSAYDERGNETERSYFGVDGKLTLSGDGFARSTMRYERGNLVERAYFGVDGKPVVEEYGYAREIWVTDEHGNEVEKAHFGVDGKPTLGKEGYWRQTMRYDERGNWIERDYFGLDGKPSASWELWAHATAHYDERGRVAEVAYFGVDGKPVLSLEGFARMTKIHDEHGNAVEQAYFGIDLKPKLDKDGVARVTQAFDELGNLIEQAYFGVDGKPTLANGGISRATMRYDEYGNVIEQAYFDVDGKPTLGTKGYARATQSFDELGNRLEAVWYGLDGKPLSEPKAKPREVVKRDAKGRIVESTHIDSAGHVVPVDGIGAKAKLSYADGDQPIAATYLDEHDKIIPIEVEVKSIVPDSTAARIALAPGDRLLSYAGEKLHSTQQLVYLISKLGVDTRKLVYRRAQKNITVEVPPGRIGVNIQNVRAAMPKR